jgi:hypothetical protein
MSEASCDACGYDPSLPVRLVGELTLHLSWPSQNQLGANARGFAGIKYRKARQEFAAALHQALSERVVAGADTKRRLWLRRVYRPGKRAYDEANLVGGGKAVVDVLVARGLLKDDSPKWFEGIYQQVPGDADAIVLTIYDIL